jgi:peptidoglycan/xylan/chitin deacetylase (PgdA/CDA1 family)
VLTLAAVGWTPLPAAASEVITHGPRSRPEVALTFDDGWSASRCAKIARTLRAKGATATFLINGANLRRDPDRWRAILRGFPVANHTLSHHDLTGESASGIRSQIVLNERATRDVLGRPLMKLLRPPYGAYDQEVVRVADSLGYRTILWDTSGGDTTSSATTSSVISHGSSGGNGAIVLLHCGPSVTPAAVGPIVESYRRRGFRLVGLDEMLLGAEVSPTACHVRDRDSGRVSTSLQAAVRAARRGHHITVRGTCRGTTTIDKRLDIRGVSNEDSGRPTLNGRGRGTVVTIDAGVAVTLSDLGIIRGKARRGGGIVNLGSLTLMDVDVSRNRATMFGGGILNRGELIVGGASTIRGNVAVDGAGITNRGTVSIRGGSSIARNEASGVGGGVFNKGLLAMSSGSTIARNEAGEVGGGLMDDGTVDGVVCPPEAEPNVRNNAPDDCAAPAPPG